MTFGDEKLQVLGSDEKAEAWQVLVVDSDPDSRTFLDIVLTDIGCVCRTAENIAEALELLGKQPADLVLVDEHLPDGGGRDLIEHLHDQSADGAVVFISTHASVSSAVAAMGLGVADYLVKPFDADDLPVRIKRVLGTLALNRNNRQLLEDLRKKSADLEQAVVAEREKAEELRRANEVKRLTQHRLVLLDKALQTTKVGVTIRDLDHRIIYTNPADATMHGYSDPEELLGHEASTYGLSETHHRLTAEELSDLEGWVRESINVRKDGSRFPALLISDVIKDSDASVVGIVTICEDISERKAAENALRQAHQEAQDATMQAVHAAKLAALGEMAANMAHELNQPLNGIKLTMQVFLRDVERGSLDIDDFINDAKEITSLVNKMAGTIDHWRAFTRKAQDTELYEVDVNASVENALRIVREQFRTQDIVVEERLCRGELCAFASRNELEQVFLNLLTNARDAVRNRMNDGQLADGKITVSSSLLPGGFKLSVAIRDNGGGVPDEYRAKIFDSFFTTKAVGEGTGLGLSISKRILEGFKGSIEVDVEEGQGSTFRVTLPIAQAVRRAM